MSFIAVTYGYNMFSIFNLNSSTQPLIDNIIINCLDDVLSSIQKKIELQTKELDNLNLEETNLRKQVTKLEEDRVKEEAKQEEQRRNEEELKKKEDKDKKKANPPPAKSSYLLNLEDDKKKENTPLGLILDEIKVLEGKILNIKKNQEIYTNKKKGLSEIYDKFKLIDKSNIKIDLVDSNTNDKVSISSKGDLYASQYLTEKIAYELNIVSPPSKLLLI